MWGSIIELKKRLEREKAEKKRRELNSLDQSIDVLVEKMGNNFNLKNNFLGFHVSNLQTFPLMSYFQKFEDEEFLNAADRAWQEWDNVVLKSFIEDNMANNIDPWMFFHVLMSSQFAKEVQKKVTERRLALISESIQVKEIAQLINGYLESPESDPRYNDDVPILPEWLQIPDYYSDILNYANSEKELKIERNEENKEEEVAEEETKEQDFNEESDSSLATSVLLESGVDSETYELD